MTFIRSNATVAIILALSGCFLAAASARRAGAAPITFADITPDNVGPIVGQAGVATDCPEPCASGHNGGRVNGLAGVPGDANTYFAASEVGGLFKTADGGASWTHLDGYVPSTTWDVAVAPGGQRVYATAFFDGRVDPLTGLQVSKDGGVTWRLPALVAPAAAGPVGERRIAEGGREQVVEPLEAGLRRDRRLGRLPCERDDPEDDDREGGGRERLRADERGGGTQVPGEALEQTCALLDYARLQKIIEVISKAPFIQITGLGGSALVGRDLSFKLMKIGYRVACEADTHVQATVSQALKKGDVQIAISYSGSKKEIVLCAEAARKQGATVIAITSLTDSPLRRLAHFTLDTVSGETEWRSSSMSTRTAQNSVTDLLFVGLVQLNDVESLKMIQRSSELTQRLK